MRRPERGELAISAAWLLACVAWISPAILSPDGVGYWAWLPSALRDHDLSLFDQWRDGGLATRFLEMKDAWATPRGLLSDHWGPGAAVAWAPGWMTGGIAAHVRSLAPMGVTGFGLPHVAGGAVVNAMLALASALLARDVSKRFASAHVATLCGFGVLFGSPLVFYGLRSGMTSHAAATFASVLALRLALALREEPIPRWALACGLCCGWAYAVRPQLLALLVLPLVLLPAARRFDARVVGSLAGGALLGALPQLVVSTIIDGSPLAPFSGAPSPEGRPYAAFERFWTWEPWLSAWHGVLPWTPFVIVGLAGLAVAWRRDRTLTLACLLLLASQAFAVATLDRPFWGGHAFGQRRLDALAGPVAIGAALLLARLPRRAATVSVLACCAWTTLLFLASWSAIDLNGPVAWPDLLRGMHDALAQAASFARPLAAIPAEFRARAALALGVVALLLLALAAGIACLPARLRLVAAVAWLAAASAWLAGCGLRTRSLGPTPAQQLLGPLQGSVIARAQMLRYEAQWLRSRGREEEAARVEARANDLQQRHDAVLSKLVIAN